MSSTKTCRTCTFCVLDESISSLSFDDKGQCNACRDALQRKQHEWWPGVEGVSRMEKLIALLKIQGSGKPYDAMLGLSGGIDSAYLAHVMVRKYGLRVLAVHVDGGWNSEPAVRNIESIVRKLDIDLHTHVVDWKDMQDLQTAFLKSSVLNQDIPQDHAFFSTLYRTAAKFKIRHFLSGVNFSSENIQVQGWGHPSIDGKHAQAIHEKFGTHKLRSYSFMSTMEYLWITQLRKQLTVHRPLDFGAYNKIDAKVELLKEYDWRDYGAKHCESRFTKFYQEIYLPRKFHFDKRRLHLSSLIVSGQLSREQALIELDTPISTPHQIRHDIKFIAKKLGITVAELDALISSPAVAHRDYPNQLPFLHGLVAMKRLALRVMPGA
jgi:N-acetyl sugar amidotransferase